MKTINEDPEAFFEEGGWNFLLAESDDEGEGEIESDESSFRASEDESADESSDDDEEEEEEEEMSEEGSGHFYTYWNPLILTKSFMVPSDSEASLDSEEEEGKDWSDLEEEAAKGKTSI